MLVVLIAGNLCVYAEDDNTDVLLMTGEVTSGNSLEISIQGSGEARDTQPVIREGEKLYLVKGQVFTLAKGWSCQDHGKSN